MSEIAPVSGASARSAGYSSIRDAIVLTVVLYALVRTSQALAGDQASTADVRLAPDQAHARQPLPSAALLSTPVLSTDRSFTDADGFSATEFRPRRHDSAAAELSASESFANNTPMLQGTSVWQRMAEYKSQDRVRVLTLWETRGSTFSLQAGKRGGPSLQWSSRRMNRDGATRGLLDRLVAAALRETGNRDSGISSRPSPVRSIAATAAIKPLNLSPAAATQ